MGRKKKKSKASFDACNASNCEQTVQYTVDDLLKKADECMDRFEFELAIKFCQRAVEIDPDHIKALETTGNIYAELNDLEKAKTFFVRAAEKSPEDGYEKFMYLGQLTSGEEAVKFFLKGIEMIQHLRKSFLDSAIANQSIEQSGRLGKLKKDESNAYCSLAEVYMTDSCFEEVAEAECEKYCKAAIEIDSANPDGYVTFANFWLSKDDIDKAKEMAVKSLGVWALDLVTTACNDDENVCLLEENSETDKMAEDISLPSYESRLSLSKILIEVGEFEKAKYVLNGLIEQNDEDIQVWYLLGLSDHFTEDLASSNYYLTKATELYEKQGCDDVEMLSQIQELIKEHGDIAGSNNDEHMDNGISEASIEDEQCMEMD